MPRIEFPATPTQLEFIKSKAFLNFIRGPRGEGKTTVGLIATLAHALEHGRDQWPIRWMVIRDTWENLKLTLIPSIRLCVKKYSIPTEGLDKLEPKIVLLGMRTSSGVFQALVELNFFGLDSPEDANRLQGFEGAGAWIEEPAPAADISSGVPEDALLSVTSLRQGGANVRPRVQITMNPSDKDHWTMKYKDNHALIETMRSKGITIAFFDIPRGENPWVTKEYRERNEAMLLAMGRPDLVARLVYGKTGYVQLGVSVTPEFGPRHIADYSLPISRHLPIIRGWDFGLNPTTTWLQILDTTPAIVYVYKSIRTPHMGCEQHIIRAVLKWQADHKVLNYHYEDYGDGSGLTPDQKNSDENAITAIEQLLTSAPNRKASFRAGPIPIPERVGPIRALLRDSALGGQARILFDPEAGEMHRALGGGWHHKKTPSGLIGDIVKDEHSEHGDSLGYPLGVKFPIPKLIGRGTGRRRASYVAAAGVDNRAWMTS